MNVAQFDWKKLQRRLRGTLEWSQGARGAYATDASVYQQFPRAVACPKNDTDVEALLAFCREEGVPIIGRGGGTSLSGQAIGDGIIVDFSRFMNGVLAVDPDHKLAVVEPGLVLDDLNDQLMPSQLLFAPDPATASRATIGGMVGNNACGTRSIVFGRTCDSIESLRCLLPNGEWLTTEWLEREQWQQRVQSSESEHVLYGALDEIVTRNRVAIQERIPDLPRNAAGYSLQYFLDAGRPQSLSDLIVGSEGTLALATQATLRLKARPRATTMAICSFDTLDDALTCLPEILSHQPSAVELLDDVLLGEAVRNASTKELAKVIVGDGRVPVAVFLVEFFGDDESHAADRVQRFQKAVSRNLPVKQVRICNSDREQKDAWEVRRLGLGLISNIPGKFKAIALIEDACIPVGKLPEYNRFVYALGEQLGLGISAYAHASVGVLHYKVMLDLHDAEERKKMRQMAEACFEKCCDLGGVFSGEHGDGIVRGEFLKRQFGEQVYETFVEVKRLFDPNNVLNPNRKIAAPPLDRLLRFGDSDQDRRQYLSNTNQPASYFRYGEQGDIVGAIEQCNGVGACRKNLKGTMCPSFRATRDERDSTRGRANLLRLAISGQMTPPGLANPDLHEALDLCLSCKACKSECPNAVDMARLKSEALQIRWQQKGATAQAKFVATMPQRLAFATRWSWAARMAMAIPVAGALVAKRYGLDRRRNLPKLAPRSFGHWWRAHQHENPNTKRRVALFVDTWNRFLEPEIAIAVVELLWSCGLGVSITADYDALRTRISVGFLSEARARGGLLFRRLEQQLKTEEAIICIEPSEASALSDDLPDLIEDAELGKRVAAKIFLLDDFLFHEMQTNPSLRFEKKNPQDQRSVWIHPHCHQRALFDSKATVAILQAAGYAASLTDLGCCGMAGSFGYAHYDVSKQVAELRFLPKLNESFEKEIHFVATGTSCREQALDLAARKTNHWAHLIRGIKI